MMVCYTCNVNKCLVLKVRKGGKLENKQHLNLYMCKTKEEGKLGFQGVEVVIEAIESSLLRLSPQIWTPISCFRNF